MLETLGAMEAAVSLYTRIGFARTGHRQIGQGAKAFELVSMGKAIDATGAPVVPLAPALSGCTEPRIANWSSLNNSSAPSPPYQKQKQTQNAQKVKKAPNPVVLAAAADPEARSEPPRPGTPSWATGTAVRLTHHATGMSSVFLVETDKAGPSGALARVRMPNALPVCVAPRFPIGAMVVGGI